MTTSRSRSSFPSRRADRLALAALALAFAGSARAATTVADAQLAARDLEAEARYAQAKREQAGPDLVVLDAVVNGEAAGPAIVRTDGDALAVEEAALLRWRVIFPAAAAFEFEGTRFVPLAAIPGVRAAVDPRTQRLTLTVPAAQFNPSAVFLRTTVNAPPSPSPWSAYLNYDVFGYTSKYSSYGSALWEVGTAGPYGAGVVTAVSNSSQVEGGNTGRSALLDAYWRFDDPANTRTFIAGTGISRVGAWGRSLRFGGVQYGTNFSLQPNLITYPVQAFAGTAVVPSTVDVFVNGSRVGSQQVSPGPFNIENVPVVTGSGSVQLVVRDAFGQQTVIAQPFYASRQLLAPGLDDFTVSAGAERQNYGSDSFDYGSGFGSVYWRRGLNDQVTVEVLAAGDNQARAAGATVDFLAPWKGVLTFGAAGSHGRSGSGGLGIAGYQYQGPLFSAGIRGMWASPDFRTPGDDPAFPLQRSLFANAGYNLGEWGSVGAAWASQSNRGQPDANTGALSYSTSISSRLGVSLSVSRSTGGTAQTGGFLSLIYSLDQTTFASADVQSNRSGGSTQTTGGLTLQRSLPVGEGYGYRLRAQTNGQYQAGLIYAGPYGRYSGDVGYQDGVTAARGSIAGGIGTIGGVVFAARPIVDSFALVQVAGVPGVSVFQGGNFAGRTDEAGNVVITQLAPYIANRIVIDDREVPIDITLASRERVAAPYYRSGVIVDFGAQRLVNATVAVRLPGGEALPSGAQVRRVGGATVYPPGLDGSVFVPDLVYDAEYEAVWAGGRCRFAVPAKQAGSEVMPFYGPLPCVPVKE